MSVAIITGASSGLGRQYALAVFRLHPEIDEFWLIARREDRLRELQSLLIGKSVKVIPLDLTEHACIDRYAALLAGEKPEVRLLINNSGYGVLGDFAKMPLANQTGMVALNCGALTAVTGLTLACMGAGSCILNVCSIAAFAPTPRMAVYSSTKAYVLSFSKALREELKPMGIFVLAACPGPMDTEFLHVAGISGHSPLFERLPRVDAKTMAERSLWRAFRGYAVYTGKPVYRLYRVLCKLLPHSWLMKFTAV